MKRALTCCRGSAVLAAASTAFAAKIAVIGTGNVGSALGPEFAALGHTIVYGSRTPNEQDVKDLVAKTGHGATATTQPEAVKGADIVVLAVPGNLAVQITQSLGDLSGKIILDPTNVVNRNTPDGYANHGVPGGSNAELIQAAAPGAKVVKAFNTLNWTKMVDPASSGGPVSIPIVGDDAAARAHGRGARERHGARARRSRAAALREHARRDARDLGERARSRARRTTTTCGRSRRQRPRVDRHRSCS